MKKNFLHMVTEEDNVSPDGILLYSGPCKNCGELLSGNLPSHVFYRLCPGCLQEELNSDGIA